MLLVIELLACTIQAVPTIQSKAKCILVENVYHQLGSKCPRIQCAITTKTTSRPVELSLPLVFWSSNFYEKCQTILQLYTTEVKASLFVLHKPKYLNK